MSSRFEALLDLYRDAMDRCIQNEVHNADCRADELLDEEDTSTDHEKELQCRADILAAYHESEAVFVPLIEYFSECVRQRKGALSTGGIAVGPRILSWEELVAEARNGTRLGLSYLKAFAETVVRDSRELQKSRDLVEQLQLRRNEELAECQADLRHVENQYNEERKLRIQLQAKIDAA